MKVEFLRASGFILDITVDLTGVDEKVKSEYHKRKKTEQAYIDKHLDVDCLKYDHITHITFVLAKLDEVITEEYKKLANPMIEKVKALADICGETDCTKCPYSKNLVCQLAKSTDLPYLWSHLLD